MPKYTKSSKEYPSQYGEVAMLSFAHTVRGQVIASWPVGPADETHRKLASATVHKFNRFRNLLWQEESPYAVASKDLSVTKVQFNGQWYVTFTVLNEYSREEKEAGVRGDATLVVSREVTPSMVEAQAPSHVPLAEVPIDPRVIASIEKEKEAKDFWDDMNKKIEDTKLQEAKARTERQEERVEQALDNIDPETITLGDRSKCPPHVLNALTNSCIFCNTPRALWKE